MFYSELQNMKLPILFLCLCFWGGDAAAQDALTPRERMLLEKVDLLEARVAALESRLNPSPPAPVLPAPAAKEVPTPAADPLGGTTVSAAIDGYYGFNFNRPVGRDNLLRAYDVTSNSFSLNQADLIVENAPDPEHGKRWGARLDLQFGQATQTLQGNPANEPRPEIYRNIFQAYGTYVFALGKGLTVDFGKWSSSLGLEGNYSKDQIDYSRSFWFDYLPFYHAGLRAAFKVNDALTLNYWMTNGTQQTEAFNNFKDQLFGFTLTPAKNVSWTANYYLGQEHPDVIFYNGLSLSTSPPAQNLPTLQGVPFAAIPNAPTGKLHILDSYVAWQATPKLSLALEADYVVQRLNENSSPDHTDGGAAYARYQLTPKFAIAGRAEYLSDKGGLFSGATQALKEGTFTLEYKVAEGLLLRPEWRRDASNHPYFLTASPVVLKKEQNTATLGLVWWFGRKTGTW